jgi:hypothetical protein
LTGDAKSRKEVETLRDEFLNTVGRISPDGNFIAYRSDEAQPERGEVYVGPSSRLPRRRATEMAVIERWRQRHAALARGRQGSVLARLSLDSPTCS